MVKLTSVVCCLVFFWLLCTGFCQDKVFPKEFADKFENYRDALEAFELKQEYEEKQRRFRSDMFLMRILKYSARKPEILNSLELTDDQQVEIDDLIAAFQAKEKSIREEHAADEHGERLVANKLAVVESKFTAKVCDALVDIQLEDLVGMNLLKKGVPRLLVETGMGTALQLSDVQKKRIKDKSNEIAKEVEEFVHEARKNAFKAVYSELDQAQKQTISDVYGKKVVENYFEMIPMSSIQSHFRFPTKKEVEEKSIKSILRTKLEELRTKQ